MEEMKKLKRKTNWSTEVKNWNKNLNKRLKDKTSPAQRCAKSVWSGPYVSGGGFEKEKCSEAKMEWKNEWVVDDGSGDDKTGEMK